MKAALPESDTSVHHGEPLATGMCCTRCAQPWCTCCRRRHRSAGRSERLDFPQEGTEARARTALVVGRYTVVGPFVFIMHDLISPTTSTPSDLSSPPPRVASLCSSPFFFPSGHVVFDVTFDTSRATPGRFFKNTVPPAPARPLEAGYMIVKK